MLPVPHTSLSGGKHGDGKAREEEEAPRGVGRRAPLGAVGAPLRLGRADRVREDQAARLVRRAGRGTRGRDRDLEEALGEGGWLKALKLDEYAARARRRPEALQDVLFPYLDAL